MRSGAASTADTIGAAGASPAARLRPGRGGLIRRSRGGIQGLARGSRSAPLPEVAVFAGRDHSLLTLESVSLPLAHFCLPGGRYLGPRAGGLVGEAALIPLERGRAPSATNGVGAHQSLARAYVLSARPGHLGLDPSLLVIVDGHVAHAGGTGPLGTRSAVDFAAGPFRDASLGLHEVLTVVKRVAITARRRPSELAARRPLDRIALLVLFRGLGDLLLGVVRVPRPICHAHRFLFGGRGLLDAFAFLCHGYPTVALGAIGGQLGFRTGLVFNRLTVPPLR
jgi:hypothetical protein